MFLISSSSLKAFEAILKMSENDFERRYSCRNNNAQNLQN